jgi:hypothetical protein
LIDPVVLLFLGADVPRITVSSRPNIDTKYPRPEALSRVILILFSIHPREAYRSIAADEIHRRCHGILWRDRDHHVHMVGQKMPFLNPTIFLLGTLSQHLAQTHAQLSVQHLAPAFRNENNVALALPLRVASALIFVHLGFSLK